MLAQRGPRGKPARRTVTQRPGCLPFAGAQEKLLTLYGP